MSKLPVAQQKQQSARRVDRLVRSFAGVIDYVASWSEAGRLYRIDILGDGSVADHQLIRNVVSGLGAGCAIKLDRAAVHVHDEAAAFAAATATPAPAPAGPAPAARAPSGNGHALNGNGHASNGNGHASNGNGNGKRNGHAANGNGRAATASTNGNGDGHAPHGSGNGSNGARTRSGAGPNGSGARTGTGGARAPDARRSTPPAPAVVPVSHARDGGRRPARDMQPAGSAHRLAPPNRTMPAVASGELQLDRIELERHGAALRCRVVLTLDEHIYAAIAEVPDSATAQAEVAARVTLDALRAGALTCARLDGVGFTSIADTTFVVAAIRDAGSGTPRAGAAPLTESMARAASVAVLSAVGPITTIHREEAELRLGAL